MPLRKTYQQHIPYQTQIELLITVCCLYMFILRDEMLSNFVCRCQTRLIACDHLSLDVDGCIGGAGRTAVDRHVSASLFQVGHL